MLDVRGRWGYVLSSLGVNDQQLSGKHAPCPICGGKDRFRFDDREGRGTWICNHCGAGTGWKLASLISGCDFEATRERVAKLISSANIAPRFSSGGLSDEKKKEAIRRVWRESQPIADGGPVASYLLSRVGYVPQLPHLREHKKLRYDSGRSFAAMVAMVVKEGKCVSLHRTYLSGEKKADVPSPKKLMPGFGVAGASIPLGDAQEEMGVAEGIETALAASKRFGLPVWAAISAHGIETWIAPPIAKRVTIFADNDENATGQIAAFRLMQRLRECGIKANVMLPPRLGTDWADECLS